MQYSLAVVAVVLASQTVLGQKGVVGDCSPLEIVYARATLEAQGLGVLGGPLLAAVKREVPGATAYAVRYPASGGDASPIKGIEDVLRYFETKPKACPQQKYVLSGYSQGAVVMHRAAPKIEKAILKDRVIATATFGDGGQQATKEKPVYNSPVGPIPVWPEELDGKIIFNCNGKDLTCNPKGDSTADHLKYTSKDYIPKSAKFIGDAYKKAGGAVKGDGEAGGLLVTRATIFNS
ncbi:alpha/beta-hydrolase [Tothia fuscella]|uniref:Alpha/beta-hydrolase n=1 Tax=Tothia fuscella TaxID=1048955 RepID=A0A9P4NYV0_9PEZI|nr:alpha/beta-hydrolase [Tothia fuscella]